MILAILIIVLIVLIVLIQWYRSRARRMHLLQDHNIPGPRPNFIFGQMNEYNSTPNVIWDSQMIDK